MLKVNLGGIELKGFTNIDISSKADMQVDLEQERIPIEDSVVDVLISMNFIGYLSKERAQFIIDDVYRILKPGGVCRFGTQDLMLICDKYLQGHPDFQCDRINEWFNGYTANGKNCKYVYDIGTLQELFKKALFISAMGFRYQESISDLGIYDNRPEQQFFIEAFK